MTSHLRQLFDLLRIPSVSTQTEHLPDMAVARQFLLDLFSSSGFSTRILPGQIHPAVFASRISDPTLPTVLVYGHYDVQPAQKSDGWKAEPFTLTEAKGKLIGRGVVDNKGQILAHIVTAIELSKAKTLAYNIKFLIEGNEETSNPDLSAL